MLTHLQKFSPLLAAFLLISSATRSVAQSITPSADGTNTLINREYNRIDISGGSLSGDGTNLFHSFSQFGLESNQIANFLSNPSIENILGRVTGGNPSLINGLIQVTGGHSNLYLINPAGIIFGTEARLDIPASFTATTANGLQIGESWFNALGTNNYTALVGNPNAFAFTSPNSTDPTPAAIANSGHLAVTPGESITLVGGTLINTGTLNTPGGHLTISAVPGEKLVRITPAGSLLSLELPVETRESLNTNPQTLTPQSLPQLLTGEDIPTATHVVTNPDGSIRLVGNRGYLLNQGQLSASSNSSDNQPGEIRLSAQLIQNSGQIQANGDNGGTVQIETVSFLDTGTISANGNNGHGGDIRVNSTGTVIQTASAITSANGTTTGGNIQFQGGRVLTTSGSLQATGEVGGTIELFGETVQLLAADINASGNSGGGTILVGGDYQGQTTGASNAQNTHVNHASRLRADALTEGNGGKVVVWSDQLTQFSGSASARGGLTAGDGGLIEVSGKENLSFSGVGDAGATNGVAGTLLLDPKNIVISATTGVFPQFDLIDPNAGGGSGFGSSIVPLSTGNVVVTKPRDNFAASNAGAVYLYNGLTGALVSMLMGGSANDFVGNYGVVALSNGNYVVRSSDWNNGTATGAGAVTWGRGTTGINGVVSAGNSLVGSTASDFVGSFGVVALSNGDYVVSSSSWDNGAATDAGAVTWGSGTTGISGVISAANSLVGSTAKDFVGQSGVVELRNGNYVVITLGWDNGVATDAGAVTWGSGTTGISGVVSPDNSLVGSSSNDYVGQSGVVALNNGNYVVSSYSWDNGATTDAGAVTWGSGITGISGVISAANSLVGSSPSDYVGNSGVVALSNGNYVVSSSYWNNGAVTDAGAVTWGSGTTGISGVVSAANSLVGSSPSDLVGAYGVVALTNGNYVARNLDWSNGVVTQAGAVTWGSGTTGLSGVVSAANSLVGSSSGDRVGDAGVVALSNGNYVVNSSEWDNGAVTNAGAVTWGSGTTGLSGVVSTANSLVSNTAYDYLGSGGVVALSNGNYVVSSPGWDNGVATGAGAVTWGSGTTGISGVVSTANSLVGSTANDNVGNYGVVALSNGNYVVNSSNWDNGATTDAGAVTWGRGTTGISGVVSAANSLVGSSSFDYVGSYGVVTLSNGNYVVRSPSWNNGAVTDAGAATWVNGTTGTTIDGTNIISAQNSLVANIANAGQGNPVEDPINGTFLVQFPNEERITVGLTDPTQLTFTRGQGATIHLTPTFLSHTLETGTTVLLQASNDITLNSPLLVNNPNGNGGDLTLQAGRSLLINADIFTDNGNLTLVANETPANGVIDNFRDPGNAEITMAAGVTLNSGTGNTLLRLDTGTGLTNNSSGNITLANLTAENLWVQNSGSTPGSSIHQVDNTSHLTANSATLTTESAGGSIGSTAVPIAVTVTNLEASAQSGGAFFTSPTQGLNIGSASLGTLTGIKTSAELQITASGNITQTEALSLTGSTTLNATGQDITLNDSANELGKLQLISANNVSMTENTTTEIDTLTITDNLALTANNGNITINNPVNLGGNANLQATSGAITVNQSIIGTQNSAVRLLANQDVTTSDITANQGIHLVSTTGTVTAGNLNASGVTGGTIRIEARNSITAGTLNSSATEGNAGDVFLDPIGDIQVLSIDAQGGTNGTGGQVDIIAGRFFRATDSFIDRRGTVTSISSAGGTGGNAITITHGGNGLTPFTVGDATTNGTRGTITSGQYTITSPQSFLGRYTEGDLQIITDFTPLPLSLPSLPPLLRPPLSLPLPLPPVSVSALKIQLPSFPQVTNSTRQIPPTSTVSASVKITDPIGEMENSFNKEFQDYFGQGDSNGSWGPVYQLGQGSGQSDKQDGDKQAGQIVSKTLQEARDTLRQAEAATGVKPALIYIVFVPAQVSSSSPVLSADKKKSPATNSQPLWQFNSPNWLADNSAGGQTSQPSKSLPTDQLQLVLVTAEGEAVLKNVSDATREQVMATANSFRSTVTQRTSKSYLKPSQQLYQWTVGQLETELKQRGIENLVFILDSGLRSLPMAALHDGQGFLIERYSIALMPSLSLVDTRYVNIKNSQVLGMGASKFTDTNQSPLPGATEEVTLLTQQLWSGRSFTNQDFTFDKLRSERQQTPFGIVHLATHGEFKPGVPSNSYIQLWDQKLGLDQVRQLGWNTPPVELLVLSACRTALGDEEAELGFAGLAVQAGVKTAVASLWYVSDEGTFGLMSEFYRQLGKAPIKAEALRRTQLGLLKGEVRLESGHLHGSGEDVPLPPGLLALGDQTLKHPYYWAAFTMIGSPW